MMLTRNAAFTKNKQSVELKCYVFMAINQFYVIITASAQTTIIAT